MKIIIMNSSKENFYSMLIFIVLFCISITVIIDQYSNWYEKQCDDGICGTNLMLITGDEPHYLTLTSVIIRHNSFFIEDFFLDDNPDQNLKFPLRYHNTSHRESVWHSTQGIDGHYFLNHGWGTSFIMIPGYILGGVVGAMMTMSAIFGLIGIIIFKISKKITSIKTAAVTSISFGLGTILFSFSNAIYSELIAALILIYVTYILFYKENQKYNASIIGSLLGFMIFLKLSYLIFAGIFLIIALFMVYKDRRNRKKIFLLIAFFALQVSLFLFLSFLNFGEEDFFGKRGNQLSEHIEDNSILNADLYFRGLAHYTFGQSYGLFVFSPLLLFSIFGMPYLWKKNKKLTLTLILIIIPFALFHSGISPEAGGWSMPSRYLVPLIPLFCIPFSLFFEKFSKNIIFQGFFFLLLYVGIAFSIIISRKTIGDSSHAFKTEISSVVYYGFSKIFPHIDSSNTSFSISKIWENTGSEFWIFLIILIIILIIIALKSRSIKIGLID